MDYDFAHLDFRDDSDDAVARRKGWVEAVLRGFRDDRPDDELVERWVRHYRTDDVSVSGAWLPEGEFGAGPMPVATYASLDKTLNAGRELLPLRMITDVTTSASHRRQGLLRRMIEDDLADAVAQGVPMAALTASEATIYGRWGFGPATFRTGVEVDTTPGFAIRSFTDPGRVELIEPADAWPHVKAVFDTFHARQRGSVEWPAPYEDIHTGAYDFNERRADNASSARPSTSTRRGAVDGFVIFKHGEENSIKVEEMIALTPDAQLGLWSFLAHMDRVKKVTFNLAHPEDPLAWALTDLNRVKTTEVEEFLWLRTPRRPARPRRPPVGQRRDGRPRGRRPPGPCRRPLRGDHERRRRDGRRDRPVVRRAGDRGDPRVALPLGVPVQQLRRAGRIAGDARGRTPLRRDGRPQRAGLQPHGVLSRPSSRSTSAAVSSAGASGASTSTAPCTSVQVPLTTPSTTTGLAPRVIDVRCCAGTTHSSLVPGPITQSSLPGSSTTDVAGRTSTSSGRRSTRTHLASPSTSTSTSRSCTSAHHR